MWNCCLTGVWSSLGAGKVPHHTTRVVICILLSDTQYLWNSTNISTNSGTTMLSSLGGWLFSGFLFTVFTWGPPCHVVLSFSKAAKYARRFSKEIVLFLFCLTPDRQQVLLLGPPFNATANLSSLVHVQVLEPFSLYKKPVTSICCLSPRPGAQRSFGLIASFSN